MDLILDVVLPLSLAFIMFSLGVGLTIEDFRRVVTMPMAFTVGMVAQLILLPIMAVLLLLVLPLPPELAVGVMILALSPGGVTSNFLTKLAGGAVALSVTLTAVVSLVAVISVPLLTSASVEHFMGQDGPDINVSALAVTMMLITAIPVGLGMVLRNFLPSFAKRADKPFSLVATALFALIIVGALAANWTTFVNNVGTLAPLLVALNLIMLALGFGLSRLLALPRPEAIAISLETGIQNGTLGIAVGTLIVEQASGMAPFSLPSGIYGITMYLVTLPIIGALRYLDRRATPNI
ncbi:MAG: bile acid:sodium symporter family protein [Rhodospirillaceae bacterium]